MKQLVTADFHIDTLSDRMPDIEKSMYNVLARAIMEKVDRITILGDIFDKRSPKPEDFKIFYKWLQHGIAAGLKFLLLVGNHDKFFSKYYDTWCYSFCGLEGIFSKDIQIEQGEYLEDDIFYGHLYLSEAKINDDICLKDCGISVKELKKKYKANLYLLGDVHKPQVIDDNVYYTGSIERLTFNECQDTKRILIVDSGASSQASGVSVNSLPLECRKMSIITIHYECGIFEPPKNIIKDQLIKIIIQLDEDSEVPDIKKIKEYFKEAYMIKDIKINMIKEDKVRNKEVNESKEPIECFYQYCQGCNYSKDIIDRGVEVMKEK
jgi:DNA repair exonuclease SbcCD nuclease subunit